MDRNVAKVLSEVIIQGSVVSVVGGIFQHYTNLLRYAIPDLTNELCVWGTKWQKEVDKWHSLLDELDELAPGEPASEAKDDLRQALTAVRVFYSLQARGDDLLRNVLGADFAAFVKQRSTTSGTEQIPAAPSVVSAKAD